MRPRSTRAALRKAMSFLEYEAPEWGRQPCDGDEERYRLFQSYLAQAAPRRVSRVYVERGRESWLAAHAIDADWVERAALYDRWVTRLEEARADTAVSERAASKASLIEAMQGVTEAEFRKLLAASRETALDRSLMPVQSLVKLGIFLTARADNRPPDAAPRTGRFAGMSDAELAAVRERLRGTG